jgi:hypothetical protein
MRWIPEDKMWLSYLRIDTDAGDLEFDLATNVHGGEPSRTAAGLVGLPAPKTAGAFPWLAASLVGTGTIAFGKRFAFRR